MFRVGRLTAGKLTPAFDVERTSEGGLRLSNITSLEDSERDLLFAHYGTPLRGKVVAAGAQHFRSFQPGTPQHFEHASYVLPEPFHLM